MSPSDPRQGRFPLALVALFLSGAAGLVHEIVWAKLLARLIGSTAHAQALVLALFMGGLALGAVFYGRRASAGASALRLYARLELWIGAYGLVLPLLAVAAAALHDLAGPLVFGHPTLSFALRFLLAVGIALLPAVWMGGTLPVLASCLTRRATETRSRVGALYAVNNLGAVLGSLVAGFVLVAWLGVFGSLVVAALLNFASAAIGLRLAKTWPEADDARAPAADADVPEGPAAVTPRQARIALVVLALSGYAAMGYEAVFSRVISLAFGGSTYSFTVMLAAFITGIGVGSAVIARVHARRALELLGALQLAAGAAFLAATPALSRLPYWTGLLRADLQEAAFGFELYQAGKAGLCLLVLLVPTACLGAGFPLVAALQVRTVSAVGSTVGRVYAWNTGGNVLGVLLTGLVVLPAAGLGTAFLSCVLVSLVAGTLALGAASAPLVHRLAPISAAVAVLCLHLVFGGGWLVPLQESVDHLRMRTRGPMQSAPGWGAPPASSFEAWKAAFVKNLDAAPRAWFGEDANATVLAIGDDQAALLAVNTKPDASVFLVGSDMSTQQLTAHVPALLARERRTALAIGYGSGVSAGALLRHPFERVDLLEISPAVLGAHEVFAPFNHDALNDPRVELFTEDGRYFLRTTSRRYDVVSSEPSNPWLAGQGAFFTVEFFEDVRERLNPGGVFCAWLQQYEQSDEGVELVLRTVASVFPSVSVVRATPTGSDLMVIARAEPAPLDFAELERRFDEPAVHGDLERIGAFNLAAVLAGQSASPERLRRSLTAGPLNRELHERLEYLAPEPAFHGSEARWVLEHDALLSPGEAEGDTWIDSYLAWRRDHGDPVSREEMEVAIGFSGAELGEGHPLLAALRALAAAQPARPDAEARRPARRTLPPADRLGFELAFQVAARYHQLGDAESAAPYYAQAFARRPGDVNTCWNFAKVLNALGRHEAAAEVLRSGLRENPRSPELIRELATVEVALGREAQARALLEQLLSWQPDATALTMLGALDEIAGQVQRAADRYRQALRVSAEYWPAAHRLVDLLDRLGRPQEAGLVLQAALDAAPGTPQLVQLRERRRGGASPGAP